MGSKRKITRLFQSFFTNVSRKTHLLDAVPPLPLDKTQNEQYLSLFRDKLNILESIALNIKKQGSEWFVGTEKEKIRYFNWPAAGNEPSNNQGEDYVRMITSEHKPVDPQKPAGRWADRRRSGIHEIVCEKALNC